MKKKIIFIILIVIVLLVISMYLIDMNRMKQDKPVIFSNWGYSYAPSVDTKKSKEVIDNLEIEFVEFSTGGGFGTIAECSTKTIRIESNGSVKFTNEYNENLIEEFEIDETVVKELEDYINKNREVFSKEDITDEDALDASSQYITVKTKDEKEYKIGGYCVIDEQFRNIAKKIIESAGEEEYKVYCKNVNSED